MLDVGIGRLLKWERFHIAESGGGLHSLKLASYNAPTCRCGAIELSRKAFPVTQENLMKQSLIAISAAAVFGLTGVSAFAASHGGAAPMATATATTSVDFSGTKADAKAMEKKADADHKTAKKACKEMKGDAEKSCLKEAKAAHEKAEAHAKGIHEMAEAKTDKERAKVTAKYEKKMADADMKAHK